MKVKRIEFEVVRDEDEAHDEFKARVYNKISEILDKLGAWLEDEGKGVSAGSNTFYHYSALTRNCEVVDVDVAIYLNEAIVTIEKRNPTTDELEYFKRIAEDYNVLDDFPC
jgi:hypothetical protein